MSGWDHRMMFERYLYDYLRKNNMHQTAEIFMREANLVLDPTVPAAIDVPDGFLHEWWLVFYDMYRSRNSTDHTGEGSNMMVEKMTQARQQTAPSPSRPLARSEQTISRLLTNADSCFNTGVNPIGSRRSPIEMGAEKVPQGISSSLHQLHLLPSPSVSNLPGNPASLTGQEVGYSVPLASGKADITSEEEDGLISPPPGFENYVLNSIWMTEKHQKELRDTSLLAKCDGENMDTSDLRDGNSNVPGDINTTSDASLTKHKSNDISVKSSSPQSDGSKDNVGASSIKFPGCATTADDLTVHQVVESKKEG